MQLPADSVRSRILWSIPASFVLALWTIGVLGAAVTGFINDYTFLEVLARIAHGHREMFWPGEFGRGRGSERLIQLTPFLAIILWPLCLVPWQTRLQRSAALVAALLIPAGLLLLAPWLIVVGLATAWPAIFGVRDGEYWQDGMVALTAASLWWWMLLPLIVLTAVRRVPKPTDMCCPTCGYSTIGLTGNVCPECGDAHVRSATAQ